MTTHWKRNLMLLAAIHLLTIWCGSFVIASECGSIGSWKDIALLPTNGDHGKNIHVTLSVDKEDVQPGDYVTISFEADQDCYLTLMDEGTSGRIIRLWPNDQSGQDNFVRANTRKQFPGSGDTFKYRIAGPRGTERVVAYATSESGKILNEDDFRALGKSGFKELKLKAKDLSVVFRENTEPSKSDFSWGTAQVNLCIGSPEDSRSVPKPSSQDSPDESTTRDSASTISDGVSSSPTGGLTGKKVVLAIGVPTEGLRYSDQDAKSFAEALKSKLRVKRSDVKLLLRSQASYDAVEKGLKWLAEKTGPEDSAIIYFSGHGTSIPDTAPLDENDGKDECFVLHYTGSRGNYLQALERKILMKDDDFNRLLKRIPARKKILVADACHSGTIAKGRATGAEKSRFVSKYLPFTDPVTGKERRLKAKSIATDYGNDHEAVMAACRDDESSYEDEKRKSGLFTYHLLLAINAGASSLSAAFKHAKQRTEEETRQFMKKNPRSAVNVQHPTLTDPHHYTGLFIF